MPSPEKIRRALDDPGKDYNHRFLDVVSYLETTGWNHRIKGDHHIFSRAGCRYLINLQREKDGKAKAYQVRQLRAVLAASGL